MRPPSSEAELIERARRLAGQPLSAIATEVGVPVPGDLRRAKGWIGQLLETALGATGSSLPEPDFPGIGVEMKTLPVDERGVPKESTYVCTAPMDGSLGSRWEASWVRRKLSRVLWVPVLSAPTLGERRIGQALLWSPEPEEEAILRADWEEHAATIGLGELWQLDARRGTALQIRPKGADSESTSWTLDDEGEWTRAQAIGFYLRASFTGAVLAKHFRLPKR